MSNRPNAVISKSNQYCSVPQCSTIKRKCPEVSMHKFPNNEQMRKNWARILRIGKSVTKYMYVCSKHFQKTDYILPDVPTNRPTLKRIAVPSLCLPQTVTKGPEMMKKEKSSKKTFHSVARKKIRSVKIDNALVSSTNSTFDEKEKNQEIVNETLHKLGSNKKRNPIETVTSDNTEEAAENTSFHRPSDSEVIFGQYVASEMRTLKDDPLLYLQTKQSILETLTSANFELINLE